MDRPSFLIDGKPLGHGAPCYVVAEAGVNHNGDLPQALALIDAAADAGADAVKFQTFSAARLVTPDAPKADYQLRNTDSAESQFAMLRRLELDPNAHRSLQAHARRRGVTFLSTPFDEASADLLESLDVPAYKLPSGELTNLDLLRHVACKNRPILLSTGMAHLGEVEQAVLALEASGSPPVALLHCVSNYPAEAHEINLSAMHTLRSAFRLPVGYSDHTLGFDVAWASVAMGACILEKHFTLNRSLPGPDHRASLEPDELTQLIHGVRRIESAFGDGRKRPAPSELRTAAAARKSVVAASQLAAGTVLAREHLDLKRPGDGLPPAMRQHLIGRRLKLDLQAGELLRWESVE